MRRQRRLELDCNRQRLPVLNPCANTLLDSIRHKVRSDKKDFVFGRADNGDHILAFTRKGECPFQQRRSDRLTALQNVEDYAQQWARM